MLIVSERRANKNKHRGEKYFSTSDTIHVTLYKYLAAEALTKLFCKKLHAHNIIES